MKIHIWGSRGSLPSALSATAIRGKVERALRAAQGRIFPDEAALARFIDQELPFGVRGTYGGNTSCVELRGGGDGFVLCDAGSGLRDFAMDLLRRRQLGQIEGPQVFHLFISHPHWDHLQGFPFFIPAYMPGNIIHIYGCHAGLPDFFQRQQAAPFFPVPFTSMQATIETHVLQPRQEYSLAGFEMMAVPQPHPGVSYGFRFQQGGKSFVYSTDAEHKADLDRPDYPFLYFFRDADLLVFDAQYNLAEAVGVKENWGHSNNLIAVELAVRAGVRRLCLFHHDHFSDDDALDRFLAETRKYLSLYAPGHPLAIDLAYDGCEIEI